MNGQCWVELMAMWASDGFKVGLRLVDESDKFELKSEEESMLICWDGEEAELSHRYGG